MYFSISTVLLKPILLLRSQRYFRKALSHGHKWSYSQLRTIIIIIIIIITSVVVVIFYRETRALTF